MADFTERFSGRALAYARHRPTYPKKEILDILRKETEFDSEKIVADIGSGTGILSRIFLENGNKVFGVEPNDDMRGVAEKTFLPTMFPKFVSIKGTAENTTLKERSVDLISVGQAMHWFDSKSTPLEFKRIKKPNGSLCVVYNDRIESNGDERFKLMEEYGRIVKKYERNGPKAERVEDGALSEFFQGLPFKKFILENKQELDFEGLVGRLTSASYMPKENGDGNLFASMKKDLQSIFDENQRSGHVTLYYETDVFVGLWRNLE